MPGDVLEVRILDINLILDWGYNRQRAYIPARCPRNSPGSGRGSFRSTAQPRPRRWQKVWSGLHTDLDEGMKIAVRDSETRMSSRAERPTRGDLFRHGTSHECPCLLTIVSSLRVGRAPFVHLVARDRHHPHPRMVKPAEPPALSQGSARKSTAGAGWGALCTAGAGFRCGFGGVDVGGAVDALARRSASALVNGVSLSLWPAMTANLSFPIEMMKCSSLIRADIHPSFDPKRPSFAILQADVQVESFAQRGGFRGGGFEKAIPFGPATYSLWTPRAIPLSSIPTR
jgi:hypothetical protein